jgi:hypothetical protein
MFPLLHPYSAGAKRLKALKFDCSLHAASKSACEVATKAFHPNGDALCEFEAKVGDRPESFNQCVKTKKIVDNICKIDAEKYGCPAGFGCVWDTSGISKDNTVNECFFDKDTNAALMECKAATCEGVKSASVAACTDYSTVCKAVVFKNVIRDNTDLNGTDSNVTAGGSDEAYCAWKADIFSTQAENTDLCASKCSEGACQSTEVRGVACHWDGDAEVGETSCRAPECPDYGSKSACTNLFMEQGCYWGPPGSCQLSLGTVGDDGEPVDINTDDEASCKTRFSSDECGRSQGLSQGAECEWTENSAGEDGTTASSSCFKIAEFPCAGLNADATKCDNYQDPDFSKSVCTWSPGTSTQTQEVVCYQEDETSVEELCALPNTFLARRNATHENRLWQATAKLPLGTRYVAPIAPPSIYRHERCSQLTEQNIDCQYHEEWPFNEDRASCLRKNFPCKQVGFKSVCDQYDECTWSDEKRGPQGEIGVCETIGADDDAVDECTVSMCLANCDETTCTWTRGPNPLDSPPTDWIMETQPGAAAYNALTTIDGSEPKYKCSNPDKIELGVEEYAGWNVETQADIDDTQGDCRKLTNKPVQCNCNTDCYWVGNHAAGHCLDSKNEAPTTCGEVNTLFNIGWPYPYDHGFGTRDLQNDIEKADMDQAEDTVYPVYIAYEDVCNGIGWEVGKGGDCKIVIGDLSPWCVSKTNTEDPPCEAYGRSPLTADGREGNPVGVEYENRQSFCENATEVVGNKEKDCKWYDEAYKAFGAGCYLEGEAPQTTSSTTSTTTKTKTQTTTTTTEKRKDTTKVNTKTSATTTLSTTTKTVTSFSSTTETQTFTVTTTPIQARTELWSNPLCKNPPQYPNIDEKAILDKCPLYKKKENVWDSGFKIYPLKLPMVMISPPVCVSKTDPTSSRLQPCLNARIVCVHSNCTATRKAIEIAANIAITAIFAAAADLTDPRTCYGNGWANCQKFTVPQVSVAVNYYNSNRRRRLPYPKSKIPFVLSIGSKNWDEALTSRVIIDTIPNLNELFTESFQSYKDDVDSLIRDDWRAATQSDQFSFFVGGETDREENRDTIMFDTIGPDFGTTPKTDDSKVYPSSLEDNDPNDDFTAGATDKTWADIKYGVEDSEPKVLYDDTLAADWATPISINDLFTTKSVAKLEGYKVTLDKRMAAYKSVEDDMKAFLDVQKDKRSDINDAGLTDLIDAEILKMEKLETDADEQYRRIKNVLQSYDSAMIQAVNKSGDSASSKTNVSTGAAVGVLVVILLLMGGGTAFFVIQKQKGKAKYQQSLKKGGAHANPAYEPANAPQNAPAQRKPSGGDVIQQGQRKVLVLDPYGDQSANNA